MSISDGARAQGPQDSRRGESGYSILQLVIIAAVIVIVTTFAFMGIANARHSLRLSSSTRKLAGYIEKVRADSVRRHASGASRASITFSSTSTYSVAMDFDNNGTIDTARTYSLEDGVLFTNNPLPAQIIFDWRGRTTANTDISLRNAINQTSQIGVTASGDVTVDSAVFNVPNDTVSTVSTTSGVNSEANVSSTPLPTPTPSPTPVPTPSATPNPTPTATPNPTPTATPAATPTATPAATPTATPAATPTATPNPTPTATPSGGQCTGAATPPSISIVKSGGNTNVNITITSGNSAAIAVKTPSPGNLTITPGIVTSNSASFNIKSNNNTRGTFTVTFSTPCGDVEVDVEVTNNNN